MANACRASFSEVGKACYDVLAITAGQTIIMLKVLLLGGTGEIGSAIHDELTARGHRVTVASRPGSGKGNEVEPRSGDSIAAAASMHDVIVSALGGARKGDPRIVVDAAGPLLAAAKAVGARLAIVGGAGSLLDMNGRRIVDDPAFPEAWKPASLAQADALAVYRSDTTGVDWVYMSPADIIEPGPRARHLRRGRDAAVYGPNGESRISIADYAAIFVDELEEPQVHRARFTAGEVA